MTTRARDDAPPPQPALSCAEELAEYWTESGRGVILTGDRDCIAAIAERLNLDSGAPVEVTDTVWALALWDDSTQRYLSEIRPRKD